MGTKVRMTIEEAWGLLKCPAFQRHLWSGIGEWRHFDSTRASTF
jgi:hypothetical protein